MFCINVFVTCTLLKICRQIYKTNAWKKRQKHINLRIKKKFFWSKTDGKIDFDGTQTHNVKVSQVIQAIFLIILKENIDQIPPNKLHGPMHY